MKYRLIDHTADFGIHVSGSGLKKLFENAAYALFDLTTDIGALNGGTRLELTVNGADLPDLMVNWLRELLFLWAGKEKLVKKTDIYHITDTTLSAHIYIDAYNPQTHTVKNEIKAVTYHQIRVEQKKDGWEAQIIFDV